MFIFATDQELQKSELMSCIMGCDHSLGQNDIFNFVYCFMILFLTTIFLNIFSLLVTCSHQGSEIMSCFKFDYPLLELESTCQFN
jgi:hypothetical protein